VILDAKRGDVGNTAEALRHRGVRALRGGCRHGQPYLGSDSLEPFLRHADKGVVILCRTSIPGRATCRTA